MKNIFIVGLIVLFGVGVFIFINGSEVDEKTPDPVAEDVQLNDEVITPKLVESIDWMIDQANPEITDPDDYKQYEQAISIEVVFNNGAKERYELGTAYGCAEEESVSDNRFTEVNCYFAASGAQFVILETDNYFVIEKHSDDASGRTDGTTEVVLEI